MLTRGLQSRVLGVEGMVGGRRQEATGPSYPAKLWAVFLRRKFLNGKWSVLKLQRKLWKLEPLTEGCKSLIVPGGPTKIVLRVTTVLNSSSRNWKF